MALTVFHEVLPLVQLIMQIIANTYFQIPLPLNLASVTDRQWHLVLFS